MDIILYLPSVNKSIDPTTIDGWIRERFMKRECVRIVPSLEDSSRCVCGRAVEHHGCYDQNAESDGSRNQEWNTETCTAAYPTDAYGTLIFSVEKSAQKARFIRTDPEVEPLDIWRLLVDVWGLEPPTLVITIQDGGEEQPVLAASFIKAFKRGLAKAAGTASTWIITSGLKTGITSHVTAASADTPWRHRSKRIHIIGFESWGLVRGADQLLVDGSGTDALYCDQWHEGGDKLERGTYLLDEGHSGFVLVDDGTSGRPSTKVRAVRQRFEDLLRSLRLGGAGGRSIRMVSLMVNGKLPCLNALFEYVSSEPRVPVVVCAGTGGLADCVATIHEKPKNAQRLPLRWRLLSQIRISLGVSDSEARRLAGTLTDIVQSQQDYITIYRFFAPDRISSSVSTRDDRPEDNELDVPMLNALLKGLTLTPIEKLNLSVTWGREDLGREILEHGGDDDGEWPDGSLDEAMTNALMYDRAAFVNLLLSNGIAMDRFLTISRLEQLYNCEWGPPNTLDFALKETVNDIHAHHKFKLPEVGWIIEKFMGFGFRSTYCRQEFLKRYNTGMENPRRMSAVAHTDPRQGRKSTVACIDLLDNRRPSIFLPGRHRRHFAYPFHELFVWAVLTNRKHLAMCFWQNGEDQLAKALIGSQLYQSLAEEAEEDYLEMEVCQQLEANANEFKTLAFELLAQCYETNDAMTLQLLTYEVRQFSKSTCISLAANCKNEAFVAHQSCQLLLADLWLGGLRIRKYINLKVIGGILFPPIIALLTFKSREELHFQAQTTQASGKTQLRREDRRNSRQDDSSDWSSDEDSDNEARMMGGEDNMAFIEEVPLHTILDPQFYNQTKSAPADETSFTTSPTPQRKVTFSPSVEDECEEGTSGNQRRYSRQSMSEQPFSLNTSFDNTRESQVTNFSDVGIDEDMTLPSTPPKRTRRSATASELVAERLGARFLFDKPPVESDRVHRQPLGVGRKILEFYSAPVTAFWSFTIGYIVFLSLFTYIVLVRTPRAPRWPEYYIIAFLITFSADQIRKILVQEPRRFKAKLKVFASSVWDSCTVLACTSFFFALFLRLHPETLAAGRVLYCVNIVFWYLRMLRLLNVNNALSPYIHMYGKMVVQLLLMCAILVVVVVVFGILRQSITYPDEDWQWALLRNIVYKPYSMLYGAMYETEITECDDDGIRCTPGYWLTPIFMSVYLLLAVLMFLNIIIAALSNIFEEVTARAQEIAKFGAYGHVTEFEQQPFLPPPFVIFSHAHMIGKFLYKQFCIKEKNYRLERSLRLLLTPEEKEKLHEFERRCVTELLTEKAEEQANSLEARLQSLTEKVHLVTSRIDHLHEQGQSHQMVVSKLEKTFLSNSSAKQSENSVANREFSSSSGASLFMTRSTSDTAALPEKSQMIGSSLPNVADPRTILPPPASGLRTRVTGKTVSFEGSR